MLIGPATATFLTGHIPGTGGLIKQTPEDFLVDEQPLYELSGAGEHVYLFIEKRQVTTTDVVARIARAFHVGKGSVGYAGLKDKHAVTRQLFSVHTPKGQFTDHERSRIEYEKVKVLWHTRHVNKLRTGHHAGNRFVIKVRGVPLSAVVHAKAALDEMSRRGVPNYVGPQRFGSRGVNHLLGRCLLKGDHRGLLDHMLGGPRDTDSEPTRLGREAYERGDYDEALRYWPRFLRHERQPLDGLRQRRDPQRVVAGIDRMQRQFMISAMQSAVFNDVLARRLADGTFDRLLPGDLAWKHDSRAVFAVDEATAELENGPDGRVQKHELSPSGPLWGADMTRPGGAVLELERDALHAFDLTEADLQGQGDDRATGHRRALREFLRDGEVSAGADEQGPLVRLAFELPRGSFATAVLREVMKTDDMEAEHHLSD